MEAAQPLRGGTEESSEDRHWQPVLNQPEGDQGENLIPPSLILIPDIPDIPEVPWVPSGA
jgi:hypothetical protein